jgi:SAM-dependent methyltransferase
MSFYSSIADAYDQLFPLNPTQVNFIENSFGGLVARKRLIDAGCGTGSLSILLARRGAKVIAFDGDQSMIQKAEEKRPQTLDLSFKVGDLIGELTTQKDNYCHGIVCFGNTLVHLVEEGQIEDFIQQAHKVLKQGGQLLLQIINYDRILNKGIDTLPDIAAGELHFKRNYLQREDGLLDFSTELRISKNESPIKNTVPLLPIRKNELQSRLTRIFKKVEVFGDFEGNQWTEDSYHVVVRAFK